MNTTKSLQAVSTLRSPLQCTNRISSKPFRPTGFCRHFRSRFVSTDSALSRSERHGLSNLRGILTIAIPSLFLTWAMLEFYDPHQRGQHSHMMRQKLQDENKASGRAQDCAEVHVSDVQKRAEQYPEHAAPWQRMRKEYEGSSK